jgi:hypothetical protein
MADSENELAALKARVAELEARAKPPEPFTPQPYQRFDPTEGMSMPRSAKEAMFMPDHVMQGIVREQRVSSVAQGPSADGTTGTISAVHRSSGLPGTTNGWVEPRPLGPVAGLQHMNNIGEAFAAREKAVAIAEEVRTAAVLKAIAESK